MQSEFRHIADDIRRQIDDALSGVGILFRVFARGKDSDSIKKKLGRDPEKYSNNGKLIQDIIGVRVALYFPDDIPIVKSILESKFELDTLASTIDKPDRDQFSVTRYNLIFKLPGDQAINFNRTKGGAPLDATFEVQLRSILSEGWHEVEHDLRYKAKDHWEGHDDLSRMLNGIVATLETSEWSMGRIFDELAYRQYKQCNWRGMLPGLLRMRLRGEMSSQLIEALNSDAQAAKELLRIDRAKLLKSLSRARPKIPVTPDNIVLFWNALGPHHSSLEPLTPVLVREAAENL